MAVTVGDTERTIVEEGILIHKTATTFFNPAQKLNRDISIEAIKSSFFPDKPIRVLGAMSATGLRELRYLREIPNAQVFFNDISDEAVRTIEENLKLNGFADYRITDSTDDLRAIQNRAVVSRRDCTLLMSQYHGYFDVIDIDPFGSCAPFVNDAFRAIKHNGLLCLTCTDKASLCSNERRCLVRYGSQIHRNYSQNETPVRTLLNFIARELAKHDASIVPVVSLSVDFYVRVIVRVRKNNGKSVLNSTAHVGICKCLNYMLIPHGSRSNVLCNQCDIPMKLCGPFWTSSLYDKPAISRMLQSTEQAENNRLKGILKLMYQEIDSPFYYEMPLLSKALRIDSCKIRELMNALANCGYEVSLVHYCNNAIKTNAPLRIVKEALLEKVRQKSGQHTSAQYDYDFTPNQAVEQLFSEEYFKGLLSSGLKPLSLPQAKPAECGTDDST